MGYSDIRSRQEALITALPASVSYSEDDTLTNGVEFVTIYIKTIIYLEHLQNLFLIDRLLLKNNYTEVGDLLLTSFTMVSVVLDFWMCKDLYINLIVQRNHQWLVRKPTCRDLRCSRLTLVATGSRVCCSRQRHSLPGNLTPEFRRCSSKAQSYKPLQYYPES